MLNVYATSENISISVTTTRPYASDVILKQASRAINIESALIYVDSVLFKVLWPVGCQLVHKINGFLAYIVYIMFPLIICKFTMYMTQTIA